MSSDRPPAPPPDPVRPSDDAARALAQGLMAGARFAALATLTPEGAPFVSRIAFGLDPEGRPLSLISDLAAHSQHLAADPRAALLLGEPGDKGDPLVHPRLTLQVTARSLRHTDPGHAALAAHYLRDHPKARLYIGFADFALVRFTVQSGMLNGGFGRAFRLSPQDLARGGTTRR